MSRYLKLFMNASVILMTMAVCSAVHANEEEFRFWIDKASKSLRGGYSIESNEEMNELLKLSKDEIVERFMNDPKFGLTALEFTKYMINRGESSPPSSDSGNFVATRQKTPQAINAAVAIVKGGDFWQLFDQYIMPSMPPIQPPKVSLPPDVSTPLPGTPISMPLERLKAIRSQHKERVFKQLLDLEGLTRSLMADPNQHQTICVASSNFKKSAVSAMMEFGLPADIVNDFASRSLPNAYSYMPPPGFPTTIGATCYATPSMSGIFDVTLTLKPKLDQFFKFAESLNINTGIIPNIADSVPLTPSDVQTIYPSTNNFGKIPAWTSQGFWIPLRNSSTNFNRKRASYVLKTFFCDDLTPIAIENPEMHGEGRHASDPACQSCHYKLDPIGGLFRQRGLSGTDFSKSESLTFDDYKVIKGKAKKDYLATWNNGSELEVGYFLKPGLRHGQWKGDLVDDLPAFLRVAPETKACVVKRLAEFFLGKDQAYDRTWVETLSSEIASGPTSGTKIRKMIKDLVLSKTFAQPDPDSSQCYDSLDSTKPNLDAPPCAVSYYTDRYCSACHSNTDNGLNVTKWVQSSNGKPTFEFMDQGQQLSAGDVFARIIDRITQPDPNLRMPASGFMSDSERQSLLLKIQQLNEVR